MNRGVSRTVELAKLVNRSTVPRHVAPVSEWEDNQRKSNGEIILNPWV